MKPLAVVSMAAMALVWSVPARAQDPLKTDPNTYKVLFENASVRVLRVDVGPGAKTSMHQHPDHMVIPLSTSRVRFTTPDGKTEEPELANESAAYLPAGSHSGVNTGTGRVEAVLIEFKSAAPGKAVIPSSRENMSVKLLADTPRAVAHRVTADPAFHEPAGSKHDYDQVVVALSPAQMSLSIDGKPAKTTWARGDVQFIGRGVPHESKNTTGKPVDFIIVSIR